MNRWFSQRYKKLQEKSLAAQSPTSTNAIPSQSSNAKAILSQNSHPPSTQ